jgi:hypothetical protein
VAFAEVPAEYMGTHELLDAAFHDKYRRHPANVVATVLGPDAAGTTLRLIPRD